MDAIAAGVQLQKCGDLLDKEKRRMMCRRRSSRDGRPLKRLTECSIAAALFYDEVGSRQNAVAQNFLSRGREVGPISRLRRRSGGNNARDDLVALAKFDSLARTQPSFETLGVSKLADGDTMHIIIVSQYVTQCKNDDRYIIFSRCSIESP
jgi:hypothetical protein